MDAVLVTELGSTWKLVEVSVDSDTPSNGRFPERLRSAARHSQSQRVSGGGVSGGETCGVSGFAPWTYSIAEIIPQAKTKI